MIKFFFCYEKTAIGWSPAVYHDDPPATKGANGTLAEIHPTHGVITVTDEFIGEDGNPLFSKLQKAYPLLD